MLLLDQNLSRRLCKLLAEDFPGIKHISDFRLEEVSDEEIWEFAKKNSFSIITCDSDYNNLSMKYGYPPKVIRLAKGNMSRAEMFSIMKNNSPAIRNFLNSASFGLMILGSVA